MFKMLPQVAMDPYDFFSIHFATGSNLAPMWINPVQDKQAKAKLVADLIQTLLIIPSTSILYVNDGSILCDTSMTQFFKEKLETYCVWKKIYF